MTLIDALFDVGQTADVERRVGYGAVHPRQAKHGQEGIQNGHDHQVEVVRRPLLQPGTRPSKNKRKDKKNKQLEISYPKRVLQVGRQRLLLVTSIVDFLQLPQRVLQVPNVLPATPVAVFEHYVRPCTETRPAVRTRCVRKGYGPVTGTVDHGGRNVLVHEDEDGQGEAEAGAGHDGARRQQRQRRRRERVLVVVLELFHWAHEKTTQRSFFLWLTERIRADSRVTSRNRYEPMKLVTMTATGSE